MNTETCVVCGNAHEVEVLANGLKLIACPRLTSWMLVSKPGDITDGMVYASGEVAERARQLADDWAECARPARPTVTIYNGHGVCTKCGWLYVLVAEMERQQAIGYRCRCLHCPCNGLCSVGCACEAIAESWREAPR